MLNLNTKRKEARGIRTTMQDETKKKKIRKMAPIDELLNECLRLKPRGGHKEEEESSWKDKQSTN